MSSMRRRYATVDVFTDRMFGGNPLAVVLDAEGLSAAQMLSVAREFNYSETTFVLPPEDPANHAQVRIFTPRSELPFAGHPNVGTAFVLARERRGRDPADPGGLVFEETAGLVPMVVLNQGGVVIGAEFRAPQSLTRGSSVSTEAAAACLSLPPTDVVAAAHPPEVVSVGLPFLVVELASREALSRSKPDAKAHEALLPLDGAEGVFAYVREPAPAPGAATVLHARMFAPLHGAAEDPATGSATAAAIGLLATIESGRPVERKWRVHQGDDMGRPSVLMGRSVAGQVGAIAVHIGGRCAPVFEGTIEI